jgi:hypothetical protein
MIHITRTSALRRAIAALALALASLALAACGGSSGKSSSSATGAPTAKSSTSASSTPASQPARLRACLKRLGIQVPSSVNTVADLVAHPPKGVSRAQLISAVQGCGGISGGLADVKPRVSATAYKQAFVNFVACMREQGVSLPTPDTSGKGPVVDTKGVDTGGAKYRAAARKCAPIIRKVLAIPVLPKH